MAEQIYGIAPILDPSDKQCCSDEKSVMIYLSELFKALPDGISSPKQPPSSSMSLPMIPEAVNTTEEEISCNKSTTMTDKLRDLCRFQPKDYFDCAQKVFELMQDAGLQNIQQVTPTTLKDPSNSRAPFVVGETPGVGGGPTILLYATYATHESDLSMWETNPFEAVLDHDRLIAKGAFADKANIVAFITAAGELTRLAALPAARPLPYKVRVMIGSTPPLSSLSGEDAIVMADKMRDFLKANPKLTGDPHYIVVSKPGGSALAPERWAIGIGCRGFGVLDVSVKAFGDLSDTNVKKRSEPVLMTKFGGPLIDAGFILSTVLATIRDPETGAVALPGIPDANMNPEFYDGLHDCQVCESDFRSMSNYNIGMKFSKETIVLGDGSTRSASLVEQLTTMPAISIAKMNMGNDNTSATGPLSASFSPEASACLHICSPPGIPVAEIAKLLQEQCNQVAPFGSKLTFGKLASRDGWLLTSSDPLVQALGGTDGFLDKCRLGAIVSSPDFDPTPCAFAEAIPSSKVITFGLNDTDAYPSAPGESIRLEDMHGVMRTVLELFHHFGTMGGEASLSNSPRTKNQNQARGRSPSRPAWQANSMDTQNILSVSVGNEETAIQNGQYYVTSPMAAKSPLSPRGIGAGSVINDEKDRKLHLALQRNNNFKSSTRNPNLYASEHSEPLVTMANMFSPIDSRRTTNCREPSLTANVESPHNAAVATRAAGIQMPVVHRTEFPINPEEVLREINELRESPSVYASKMENILECFDDMLFTSPDNFTVQTSEGKQPVLEAIRELRQIKPLPHLQHVECMGLAAQKHAEDLEKTGTLGHIGSDGSKAGERLNRYGQFKIVAGEVIAHHSHSGFGVVSQLLACDGEQSRANRNTLLGRNFNVCGIGVVRNHPSHGIVWIITLAGGFGEPPLQCYMTVSSEGGMVESEFSRVLDSIPVEHVWKEVSTAIKQEFKVTIQYKPGEAEISVYQESGAINITQCSWNA